MTCQLGTAGCRQRRINRRAGLSLVGVMVLCSILGVITVAMVRSAATIQRHVRRELDVVQCRWLVEAGYERAIARRQADPQYPGEIWQPAGDELPGHPPALVSIEITDAPAAGVQPRQITVTAVLADQTPQRVEQTHSWLLAEE